MNDIQATMDRCEIGALAGEFADAGMMRDYDRFAALFTPDGVWRIPDAEIEFFSRDEIRAGIERLQSNWSYFVQNVHPGTIQLNGDTAMGRTYIAEFGQFHGGSSHMNYSIYHDEYRRTSSGWKFTKREYEVKYLDTTPLPGTAPQAKGATG